MHHFIRVSWVKGVTFLGNFEFFYCYQKIFVLCDNFCMIKQMVSFVQMTPCQTTSADTRHLLSCWAGDLQCAASSCQHHWWHNSTEADCASLNSPSYPWETAVKRRAPCRPEVLCRASAHFIPLLLPDASWQLLGPRSCSALAAARTGTGSSTAGAESGPSCSILGSTWLTVWVS